MRDPFLVDERQLFVTASVGVALYPEHGVDYDSLMAHADAALLHAKERGRDTSEVYGVDVTSRAAPMLQLEGQLHHALSRGEIWVAYQPLIDLNRGQVAGAEALVRWTHPLLGELSPDEFLPVAEESGLVAQLDTFVLLTACRQAARWNAGRAAADRLSIAVNFSARQLHTASVVDIVTDALAATGLPPELLEIEISERLAGRDSPEISDVLARLRESGVRVGIDDFGTGYSALSRLDRFPLDNVKIDKSFVSRIVRAGDEAPIVVATIAMAHGLGLTVTAEGVETLAQLDFLRRHGCDVVQGYLLGRPKGGDAVPRSQLKLLDAVTEVAARRP
jgi:EAL domain-containing protein (putative c-di-GMP-specific phosphodiesterase class I)